MPIVIICHDIRSTHNIGSILRTADGFGVSVVVACGLTPYIANDDRPPHVRARHTKEIAKTALGAETSIPMKHFSSTENAILSYSKEGYVIIAIEQDNCSVSLRDFIPNRKNIAVVLGSETSGMPKNILDLCDVVVEIPMSGKKESFNVSVACGIALYQLTKN